MTKRFSPLSACFSHIATPKVGGNLSRETSTFQSITDMNTARYLIHPFQPSSPPKSDYPDEKCIRLQTLFSKKKNFLLLDLLVFLIKDLSADSITARFGVMLRGKTEQERKVCCERLSCFDANKLNFGRSTGGVIADILRLMGRRMGWKKFAQVFSSVRYIFRQPTLHLNQKIIPKRRTKKSRKTKNVRESCR